MRGKNYLEPNYANLVIKNNKIIYKLWQNCSSYGYNIANIAIAMSAISVTLQSRKHTSLVKCVQGKHSSLIIYVRGNIHP